ncbi:hypothetical protein Ddye_019487 [Dipteronia dyeriana]|uniref:Uncharacterized protein n=1 Tax=Dipteronia dyeriana TaxID=168575 RepID=A0AAD9TYE5_9ROSI|nr:hypothetical protein Ddye_019487 [Dipteronia dyeriana]
MLLYVRYAYRVSYCITILHPLNLFVVYHADSSATVEDMPPKKNKKSTPAGKRIVGSSSRGPHQCVRNQNYMRRMAKLEEAQFIFERGIHLEELKKTTIPDTVRERKL